jgi:peptidoglycan/xylan/chitin deacetylase (PgdA/CDA1 family)/GT2 family glycosyltransferase
VVEISIVLPTYNRSDRLGRCLASLGRQSLAPRRFEVVVAVDGPQDATRRLLETIELPCAVRPLWLEHGGSSRARNAGIQAARGEYVLNLDDDMVASPRLVEEHLRAQRGARGAIGIGRIELRPSAQADWYARYTEDGWRAHYRRLGEGTKPPTWDACYGGNLSAPRADLLAVGGFDEEQGPGADVELGYRLVQRGLRLVYLAEARAEHDDLKNCRRQTRETEVRGRGNVRIARLHPETRRTLIGSFACGTRREVALRRLAITLRVGPTALAPLHVLARRVGHERLWWKYLYRLAVWRGVRSAVDRPTWRRLTRGTPILMYHAFARPDERPSRWVVSARQLRRQLLVLRLLRRRVLSLDDLLGCLASGEPPPERAVVITIDDGYEDVHSVAAPIFRRAGVPVSVFVVTGPVGGENRWVGDAPPLVRRRIMDWQQIADLERCGASIGGHTRSHPDLRAVPAAQARDEIAGCRADLEEALGHPVTIFAYPYGRLDDGVRSLVREAGYEGAVSVYLGGNDIGTPLDALRRNEVKGTHSLLTFVRTVLAPPSRRPPPPP